MKEEVRSKYTPLWASDTEWRSSFVLMFFINIPWNKTLWFNMDLDFIPLVEMVSEAEQKALKETVTFQAHCCCEWMFSSVMFVVDLHYCWTAEDYPMWYKTKYCFLPLYFESVTQLTLAQSTSAAMCYKLTVCLAGFLVLFLETTSCLWDLCVPSAEDAGSAAQGERWCMQQIVAAAALPAAEADNSDGFRLKAPQIPSRPTRWATSSVCATHPLVAFPSP